jgi:Mrp family chromosome partitioning ATPase
MTTQLAAARAQKADAEAKAKLIRDMLHSGQPIESTDILNSELIRRLSEQRVTLRAQLAEQSSSLLDNHPRIKELKAQIADLDHQITNEAATTARSLENDAKIASARVDSLTASLDQLKNQAATSNADDVQLRELERDAKSQRDLLESYLGKYREATSRDTINSSPADARVISRATVSNLAAYPKKIPAVLIATLTTLMLAMGIVLTRALLAAPVAAVGLEEPVRDEPFGGDLPPARIAAARNPMRHRSAPEPEPELPLPLPVAARGGLLEDVASEFCDGADAGHRIAVFGAVRGMDVSFAALKLARTLVDDGRVVLVGLGAADAAIRAASNEPSAPGLADLADGSATFGDIITKDVASGLHLISSGEMPADRVGILAAPQLATSFDALARSYDHVVFAAGTVVGPELDIIGVLAPRAVLVAEALHGTRTASASARLIAAGFDDVTVLIEAPNDARSPAAAAA